MKLISDKNSIPPLAPNNNPVVTGSVSNQWGWFPVLSLTCALGLLLVVLGIEASRLSSGMAEPLFWIGLLVLYVPVTIRILSPQPARRERFALVILLGVLLSLFRYLEQPLAFSFNDEFPQWRTALDIARSGHLFQPNPILSISPFYPGLQIATNALSSMSGLSIFLSGMIVLGVAQLMMMLALYLFYEYLSDSPQVAALAMLFYMAKPTFFQDTLFHYEDLALPLIAFILFALAYRISTPGIRRIGLTLTIWLALASVVVSHHVASFMLVLFLLLWTALYLFLKFKEHRSHYRGPKALASPGVVALVAIILTLAWTAYTGAALVNYLFPTVQTTINQIMQILTGQAATRQAFGNSTGSVEPLWQRLVSYGSILLIMLGLPFGLFQIWRRHRFNAAILALGVSSLAFPAIVALRLTSAGDNLGGRAQPYVFTAAAFVLAIAVMRFIIPRLPNWKYSMLLTAAMTIIFIGGWVIGTSPDTDRLPGPYSVFSDQRSIQPESVTAAEWAYTYLGSERRIIGDHVNLLLMGTYGQEWLVTASSDQLEVAPVFTDPTFDHFVQRLLRQGRVRYIVVDDRLYLPKTGWYQGVGPVISDQTAQTNEESLTKFNNVPDVSRVFDSGNIVIYDVKAIVNGTSTSPITPPSSSCVPKVPGTASGAYPTLAKLYVGTIFDIPSGLRGDISFNGMQEQQGTLCGFYTGMPSQGAFAGIAPNGPILGVVTTANQIQFSITNKQKTMTFTFSGIVQSDGTIAGTYCGQQKAASNCSDYGLWSVSPTH